MKTNWANFMISGLIAVAPPGFAATNDLSAALQRGLFEEEANHNLDSAIQAYQSVINQYDKDRKLAATAIFRLGESYRKQGKTNEAAAQYERITRDFADQSELLTASRNNLATFGYVPKASSTASLSQTARQEQKRLYDEEIKLAEKQLAEMRKKIETGGATSGDLIPLERDLLRLKRQLAALDAGQPSEAIVETEATSAEAEEVRRIQALIKESPDLINAPDQVGETLLQRAAAKGETAVVKMLLDNGAAVDGPKQPGLAALHYAVGNGHKAVVDLLLSRGAKVDARSESGVTPLHLAALKGYGLVAKTLLDAGASVNARTDKDVDWGGGGQSIGYSLRAGQTPLHAAAGSGYSAMVELLLSKGADVNAQDAKGRTPLSYAAERRDAMMAKTLLDANADPNAGRANLPLQYAAWNGDVGLLELLLTKGANADTNSSVNWSVVLGGRQNYPGGGTFSPLLLAVSQRHAEAVRLLVRYKADPNRRYNNGNPLLFDALSDVETLKALLEGGASPNVSDSSGVSALHREVEAGNQDSVQLLLAHGADVNAASQIGVTPLHEAARRGAKGIAELLLQKGADVNARTQDGDTPLHWAVSNNHSDLVELLLQNKADPNSRNNAGITPLMLATAGAPTIGRPMAGSGGRSRALPAPRTAVPYPTATAAPAGSPSSPSAIADLLRQHGALEDVPRLDAIQIRRPGAYNDGNAMLKGTNDWNQFTVMEVLAMEYGLLTKVPSGESQQSFPLERWADRYSGLAFPDFEKVRIRRPALDLRSWQEETVDLSPALSGGNCSKDVSVKWGDVLEIPEADHPLNERWLGFSTNQWANFEKCLSRQVEVIVKGRTTKVTLAPASLSGGPLGGVEFSPMGKYIKAGEAFWIKPALRKSNVLLASSDLSRVKVTRRELKTGQEQEWTLDCSDSQPAPDFWLRDGDIIEVPDKS